MITDPHLPTLWQQALCRTSTSNELLTTKTPLVFVQ